MRKNIAKKSNTNNITIRPRVINKVCLKLLACLMY